MTGWLQIWNLAAAVLWYSLLKRRVRFIRDKSQKGVAGAFVISGIISFGIALFLYSIYPDPVRNVLSRNTLLGNILVVGLVEEAAKFVAFILAIRAGAAIREPQDGVIFGAAVGLAFGTVENIFYIEQYRDWFMLIRPLLTSPAHAIYGAIWGGLYSQAVYANLSGVDRGARRNSAIGVPLVAIVHGSYNAATVFLPGAVLINVVGLGIAVALYRGLVERSPYRIYPLSRARAAIPAIRRGLVFNPKSPILNKNLGLYLMHVGEFKKAAEHLRLSVPRTKNPRPAQFLAAACETTFVPRPNAMRALRITWARLGDGERRKSMEHLGRLVGSDSAIYQTVSEFISRRVGPRRYRNTRDIARDAKVRRYRRTAPSNSGKEHR